MLQARALLMVLITVRLLMPPGICACKWSSPAARFLVALAQSQRDIPSSEDADEDDDVPGCPASPLAVGMGVKPPSEPLLPPGLSLDPPPSLPETPLLSPLSLEPAVSFLVDTPVHPLYLTLRALRV